MKHPEIDTDHELIEFISQIGFLPLLASGIDGFSADDVVSDDCRYVTFPDGGWDWPLWKWKGRIIRESSCYYGKFFNKKAGFITREWWSDFCNYRHSKYPYPEEGTIESAILQTLEMNGSMITRDLRKACGFEGKGMRSKFDGYLTQLEMGCHIIIEDFVYPHDKHGEEYGWGWSLLTTPEMLYGRDIDSTQAVSGCQHTPEASFEILLRHFRQILPEVPEKQLLKLIG